MKEIFPSLKCLVLKKIVKKYQVHTLLNWSQMLVLLPRLEKEFLLLMNPLEQLDKDSAKLVSKTLRKTEGSTGNCCSRRMVSELSSECLIF